MLCTLGVRFTQAATFSSTRRVAISRATSMLGKVQRTTTSSMPDREPEANQRKVKSAPFSFSRPAFPLKHLYLSYMKSGFFDKIVRRMDRLEPAEVQRYLLRLVKEQGFFEKV